MGMHCIHVYFVSMLRLTQITHSPITCMRKRGVTLTSSGYIMMHHTPQPSLGRNMWMVNKIQETSLSMGR